MTARITEQSMTAPATTSATSYAWHPRQPKHRAGDVRDWLASLSLVPQPVDLWAHVRDRE